VESSLCENPERHASRRLSDHLTFEGQKQKVHSLVDKVYSRENLGAVAICVGIDFGAISSMTRLSDHAARSIV
jgi:hypothetical protein